MGKTVPTGRFWKPICMIWPLWMLVPARMMVLPTGGPIEEPEPRPPCGKCQAGAIWHGNLELEAIRIGDRDAR